ncbi:hypothetical protein [Pseudoxanthomonas sp. 10H]|uniref:hypothetical protein n=1 Tax=Pseudoxanthomonas sp. 10H TaxID=3242729 RepID=UPI0035562DE6
MNAGTAARLDALRADMDAIRAALDHEDLGALPAMIDGYDARVREFCALPGANAFGEQVRALRDLQLDTIECMRERNARLLGLIRQQRQSSRVASSYAQAGLG